MTTTVMRTFTLLHMEATSCTTTMATESLPTSRKPQGLAVEDGRPARRGWTLMLTAFWTWWYFDTWSGISTISGVASARKATDRTVIQMTSIQCHPSSFTTTDTVTSARSPAGLASKSRARDSV